MKLDAFYIKEMHPCGTWFAILNNDENTQLPSHEKISWVLKLDVQNDHLKC
jgi:hypothetical protein